MSEPSAALIKLQIGRKGLSEWLNARPQSAGRWSDWRDIGGSWHARGGVQPFARMSDEDLAAMSADVDRVLARFDDNRAYLRVMLGMGPKQTRIAAYSSQQQTFLGGSLMFDENLRSFMIFLVMARSAADFLGPGEHGLVLIHNFLFGNPENEQPTAALRLSAHGQSSFIADAEKASAVPAFEPFVEAMLEEKPIESFSNIEEIDASR